MSVWRSWTFESDMVSEMAWVVLDDELHAEADAAGGCGIFRCRTPNAREYLVIATADDGHEEALARAVSRVALLASERERDVSEPVRRALGRRRLMQALAAVARGERGRFEVRRHHAGGGRHLWSDGSLRSIPEPRGQG